MAACEAGAMGNRHSSNVADDVKRQAECQTPTSKFVDLSGGGELIDLMKAAIKDKNYTEVSFIAISVYAAQYLLTTLLISVGVFCMPLHAAKVLPMFGV